MLLRHLFQCGLVTALISFLIISTAECKPLVRQSRKRNTLQNPETIQADLPAEVVPQLLGAETGSDAPVKNKGIGAADQGILNVCILTADFWGLKSAGGTATAYHLLAAVLAKEERLNVTFLQVTNRLRVCEEAQEANKRPGMTFACLARRHFLPEVAESSPYESVAQAVIAWVQEEPNRCDIVHVHEWGGVFADLVTLNHFRQLQPGLRVAVEPHGGHVWSQLGEVNRPMDVYALRIDSNERATNALNDMEISPTKYMLAYLRQRGWTLPNSTLVIPNIVPDAEKHALDAVAKKKVWRIAFFGRLEERKGIKLFVEAINKLQDEYTILDMPRFEIYIVGPDAVIDMIPSKEWLAKKTAGWKVKTHLNINVPRDQALEIISREGMLLVLCSYIDNMPYVVAEAAIKAIPFIVFDAGGVLELFSHESFSDNVIKHATSEALASKLDDVLERGTLSTVQLGKEVTNGKQKWLEFHKDFATSTNEYLQEDKTFTALAEKQAQPARVVTVKHEQSSLDLWEPICLKGNPESDEPLLLIPEGYSFAGEHSPLEEIGMLLKVAEMRNSPVRALTFGIELPNDKVAFPSAPTWIAYAGDHQHCMNDIPIAIATNTFCNAFLGQARVFQYYNAWILAFLLDHTKSMMHTYPRVLFKATEYTNAGGSNCASDKVPKKRAKDYITAASRLFSDPASMMHGMVLASAQKPLASLLDDASSAQQHKGWEYGYLDGFANETRGLNRLTWQAKDSMWGCGPLPDQSFINFPHFKHQLLHPCHHGGMKCCNGTVHAPFLLRYTSFINAEQAGLQLSYDAFPVCGDGFDFLVTHRVAGSSAKPTVILEAGYDPVSKSARPQRQTLEVPLDIRPGDEIDFVVDPRHNHDCDGLYIIELKIWPALEEQRT